MTSESTRKNLTERQRRFAKDGLFPPGIELSVRTRGWFESEIVAINHARAAGASDDQIRALVKKLLAERKGTNEAA